MSDKIQSDVFAINKEAGSGYQSFKVCSEGWPGCGYEWQKTELKIRRVITDDRNEVQISINILELKRSGRMFQKYAGITIPAEHINSFIAAITNPYK